MELVTRMETDFYSSDLSIVVIADGDEPIFSNDEFMKNQIYIFEELCLDPSRCYELFVFDTAGDGFNIGGVVVEVDEVVVLEVNPGDSGTPCEQCGGPTTYWVAGFGTCG